MSEEMSGSTVPRRRLGRLLEEARENAGLNRKDAAKALERSAPTLWRIETGRTPVRGPDVAAMCRLYKLSEEMTEVLVGLSSETKAKGWWQAYGDVVPEWFDLFVGMESAASRIDWFENDLAPGLLQTEAYARTLIQAHNPDESEGEIERRVQLRLARQKILNRPISPPELRIVLRESVLRCPVGGASVMAEQLKHVTESSELPNVSLRVVAFAAGFNLGMLSGSFGVLRFPPANGGGKAEPPTVYSDLFSGALYLDKPHEVARYDRAFDELWDMALDEAESREMILKVAKELRDG